MQRGRERPPPRRETWPRALHAGGRSGPRVAQVFPYGMTLEPIDHRHVGRPPSGTSVRPAAQTESALDDAAPDTPAGDRCLLHENVLVFRKDASSSGPRSRVISWRQVGPT